MNLKGASTIFFIALALCTETETQHFQPPQISSIWSRNNPMLFSMYTEKGEPTDYFMVAVPKPTQNVTKIVPTPSITSVEIVKSIELPIDQMPLGSETSGILTKMQIPASDDENIRKTRSDASWSLFRPQTIEGFRALFKPPDKKQGVVVSAGNSTSENDLVGPVYYTKSPINIFVDDPSLINIMVSKLRTSPRDSTV